MPDSRKVYRGVHRQKLDELVREILDHFPDVRVFALTGPLGSGKTTLVKAFGKKLGVAGGMSSPTFGLVNEYTGTAGSRIYHFDFYRIRNEQEAQEIGTEEYLFSGAYCFVEWPENISHLMPDRHVEIRLYPDDETHRTIEIISHG
ncbi:MAG: tRNA (adenosine(37)-N6)-threonylcarbamoyltransferase complex ATPase subunit type 1 TsaE [Cyclobacteriaceae bacterium]|nr:MAG: tRNA (adenosine(37)-N6)-threonylcarbamoyltransferase complex ATPase subunit type 1 TsaE [Cyclobacteriaceae bacterium]